MFGENEFVSEYDAGKFAGVVYGINQRSYTLADSFAGDGAGNGGNDAGSTWYRRCMRCEVGSSTKLAPSRRVSTKIGSASSFCTPRPSIIAAPLPPDITSPGATHLDRQSNLAATTEHKLAFTCHTKNYQFVRDCSQIDHCPCVHTLYYPLTVQRCTTIHLIKLLY